MLDLLLTISLLRLGAVEVNPIMARLLEAGPGPAAAAKIGVMALATLALWLLRRYRTSLTTSVLLLAGYGALVVLELFGLMRLL